MRDAIEKFLRDRQTAVPFTELATRFFKIENLSPHIAEQLLAPVLANAPTIVKEKEGYVYVGGDEQNDILLVQLTPVAAAHYSQVQSVHLYNHRTREIRVFQFKDDDLLQVIEQLYAFAQNSLFIFNGQGNQISTLNRMLDDAIGSGATSLNFLHVLKKARFRDEITEKQCDYYSTSHIESDLPDILFQDFIDRFQDFMQVLSLTLDELITDDRLYANFDDKDFDSEFLASLSTGPGVYVMRTKAGKVFYVGKAKNVNARVNSYFQPRLQLDEKHKAIWKHVDSIEIRHCGSELEALLLEQKLFDELHPHLNIVRKVHPRHKLQKERYPRILILAAVQDEWVQVYFMNPGFYIDVLNVDKNQMNKKELAACIEKNFFSDQEAVQDEREELITSWLAGVEGHVAGIDMRTVATVEKALQLTMLNIQQFSADDAVIFQL